MPFEFVHATTKNNKWYFVMNTDKDSLKNAAGFTYDDGKATWVPDKKSYPSVLSAPFIAHVARTSVTIPQPPRVASLEATADNSASQPASTSAEMELVKRYSYELPPGYDKRWAG